MWGKTHQTFESICCFAFAASFKQFSHSNQGDDHGCRFKVKVAHALSDCLQISCRLSLRYAKKNIGAPTERRCRTQSNKRIHIGRLVEYSANAVDKKFFVDGHNGEGQHKL